MTDPSDAPFDAVKALKALAESQLEGPGRKLSLFDQCQACATLISGMRPDVVAKTFAISRISASQIKTCLSPGATRYRAVKREFDRLGEDAFIRKYCDRPLIDRLLANKYLLASQKHPRGPNPYANAKAFDHIGAFAPVEDEFYLVDWVEDRPAGAGWWFADCDPKGNIPIIYKTFQWKGRETLGEGDSRPFHTSTEAWKAAYAYCNRDAPQ